MEQKIQTDLDGNTSGSEPRAADQRGMTLLLPPAQWIGIASALRLSPRELEVVRGVFECGCDPVIALRLGISPHTVHAHLDRIYRKLNLSSRCDLVLKVFAAYLMLQPKSETSV